MNRFIIAALGTAACAFGIWQSVRIGVARTEAKQGFLRSDMAAVDRAIRWQSNDAETHASRGAVLQRLENYSAACQELERAIQLRPRDYYLWMLLGVTRDLDEKQPEALLALQRSSALAPAYAKPHWLVGNLLLRMGRIEEAFNELRLACASDASLLPKAIDLAWGTYQKDPAQTVTAIRPRTDSARVALAVFFAQRRQGSAAIAQFREAQTISDERLHELLHELLRGRLFVEAGEVWAKAHGARPPTATVMNAGFEEEIAVGGEGFGWQIPDNVPNVKMSVDAGERQSGAKSLRIDFQGDSNSTTRLVGQLVLVQPNTHYRLTFQSSSSQFASIAAPTVAVLDASSESEALLAQSTSLSGNGWREFVLDFTTGSGTQAIRLVLYRQGCPGEPCPAFGTLWLDSFQLSTAEKKQAR